MKAAEGGRVCAVVLTAWYSGETAEKDIHGADPDIAKVAWLKS